MYFTLLNKSVKKILFCWGDHGKQSLDLSFLCTMFGFVRITWALFFGKYYNSFFVRSMCHAILFWEWVKYFRKVIYIYASMKIYVFVCTRKVLQTSLLKHLYKRICSFRDIIYTQFSNRKRYTWGRNILADEVASMVWLLLS